MSALVLPATSAGTHPARRVHPRATTVARRHGVELGRPRTARVSDVLRDDDLVIAVCDNAHEHLPIGAARRLHWSVADPVPADTDEAFETAYGDLAVRIERLAPAFTPRSAP